jgi:hypothetical protein
MFVLSGIQQARRDFGIGFAWAKARELDGYPGTLVEFYQAQQAAAPATPIRIPVTCAEHGHGC